MPHCAACGDDHPDGTSLCPRTGDIATQGPCGKRIDRYEVERWIGGGGMGAVYIARHSMLQHRVALKLLHPSIAQRGDILERFLREARATASLGNRHIVRVHDCAVTPEGTAFIAMEKLEGESLQALIDREKKVEPTRAAELILQVLEGLGEAHAAGIVHRDMKPGNVFVTPPGSAGGSERATILDFGISKMRALGAASLTQTGTVMGTPHYMAPEQIWNAKEIDHRADLYAVGVMLYEMLAGRLPYEANNTAELLVKACTTDPIPLRDLKTALPAPLVEVVDLAMRREPAQRYQTAAEFADALRGARDAIARASAPPATLLAPPATPPVNAGWHATAATAWGAPAAQPAPVWGAAPMAVTPAQPPARPRRRWLLWTLVLVGLTSLACIASIAFLWVQDGGAGGQADAGAPTMVPINTPQGQSESLTNPTVGIVLHPGPGGVTLRPGPGGTIHVVQNSPDAGDESVDDEE